MSDLPDDFDCTLTNWEYIYGLCRNVSNAVKRADFEPDVVVALARGGWFAGRCICDFLGLNDLTSLKMEHYVGAAEKSDEPQIRYPMPEGSRGERRPDHRRHRGHRRLDPPRRGVRRRPGRGRGPDRHAPTARYLRVPARLRRRTARTVDVGRLPVELPRRHDRPHRGRDGARRPDGL